MDGMSLTEINQRNLDELAAKIEDAEKQRLWLANYIDGLRALHEGGKTFLEKKNSLAADNIHPLFDTEKVLEIKSQTTSFSSEINPGGPRAAEILKNQFEDVSGEALRLTETSSGGKHFELSENVALNENFLKGLTMFEALKKYLSMFSEKQTVKTIVDGLTTYGFQADIKHLYESVRGMLRYYEKKDVFERDGATWGLSKNYQTGATGESRSKKAEEFDVADTGERTPETVVFSTQIMQENKPPKPKIKTNTEYCREILQKSGQPWLHVDQILVYLKNDYGIIRDKAIIAAALRKNSNNKNRIFKAFGGNRFGLLEEEPAVVKAAFA